MKGYELINAVHEARAEWRDQLEDGGEAMNLDRLSKIKAKYWRGVREDAVYQEVYERARVAFLADVEALRTDWRRRLQPLSKRELGERLGMTGEMIGRRTKDDLIEMIVGFKDDVIESEHARVKCIWAGLTQAQREGFDPLPEVEA